MFFFLGRPLKAQPKETTLVVLAAFTSNLGFPLFDRLAPLASCPSW